jgi:hypothetical protein
VCGGSQTGSKPFKKLKRRWLTYTSEVTSNYIKLFQGALVLVASRSIKVDKKCSFDVFRGRRKLNFFI